LEATRAQELHPANTDCPERKGKGRVPQHARFARRAAGVALGVGGYERRSSSAGAMRVSLRLGRGRRPDVKPAPSCTTRRTVTGGTRVLDPADTIDRQPGPPKQKQCRLEPTGQSILMRLSSWPALHIADPINTIVDHNRSHGISATSQRRQCCKSQLGFSVVRLGIPG
jgi:hypothetical protein